MDRVFPYQFKPQYLKKNRPTTLCKATCKKCCILFLVMLAINNGVLSKVDDDEVQPTSAGNIKDLFYNQAFNLLVYGFKALFYNHVKQQNGEITNMSVMIKWKSD